METRQKLSTFYLRLSTPFVKYRSALVIVFLVLIIDQAIKFYVKTHFSLGEEVVLTKDWARLHFLENEGMAFGLKLGDGSVAKLLLTLFRLGAVVFGFFLLRRLCKQRYGAGLVACGALILAGAAGNLIDSVFYGLIFSESPFHGGYATLVPFGQGYGRLFYGKVVDMFYFPLFTTKLPQWLPFVGGNQFSFFEPVFNFADAAISVGVLTLVLFQRRLMGTRGLKARAASRSTAPVSPAPVGAAVEQVSIDPSIRVTTSTVQPDASGAVPRGGAPAPAKEDSEFEIRNSGSQ